MDNSEVNNNLSGATLPTQPDQPAQQFSSPLPEENPAPKPQKEEASSSPTLSAPQKKEKNLLKLILIIAIVVLILSILIISIYLLFFNNQSPKNIPYPGFEELYISADSLDSAFSAVQEYIDSATLDEEKANRYYKTAIEIFDACHEQQACASVAMENLERAFKLHPTMDTAWRLYDYYDYLGNTEKSEIFLKEFNNLLKTEETSVNGRG